MGYRGHYVPFSPQDFHSIDAPSLTRVDLCYPLWNIKDTSEGRESDQYLTKVFNVSWSRLLFDSHRARLLLWVSLKAKKKKNVSAFIMPLVSFYIYPGQVEAFFFVCVSAANTQASKQDPSPITVKGPPPNVVLEPYLTSLLSLMRGY